MSKQSHIVCIILTVSLVQSINSDSWQLSFMVWLTRKYYHHTHVAHMCHDWLSALMSRPLSISERPDHIDQTDDFMIVLRKWMQTKAKQLALPIALGVFPNSNNTLQDQFLHQIGWHASTSLKVAAVSAVSDKIQELQAIINGMVEKSKALNVEKRVLQEHMRHKGGSGGEGSDKNWCGILKTLSPVVGSKWCVFCGAQNEQNCKWLDHRRQF